MDWYWWGLIVWGIGSVILLCWMGYTDEDPLDDPNFLIVVSWPMLLTIGLLLAVPFGLYKLFQWLGWKRKGY